MQTKMLLLFCGLLVNQFVSGQCPDRNYLLERLIFITNDTSSNQSKKQLLAQLSELLSYELKIRSCAYRSDSTHALLLQRIGVLYFKQGDFIQAIHFTRLSINMVAMNVLKPSTNTTYLIKNYYNLSFYYAQLNKQKENIEAIDSCINIANRLKIIDDYYLYALSEKLEHLFNIGEYNRCYQYAVMGETAIAAFAHSSDSIGYVINFLTLKVNVLLNFKNYDLAEKLLKNKVEECKSIGAKQHLGTITTLLARMYMYKKNTNKAFSCYQLAVKYHLESGFNLGCMQALNNLAYTMYFKHYGNSKKSLATYNKALKYVNNDESYREVQRIESLNILTNIANVHVLNGNFDSAYHYYQLAFDQISPGMNETGLVNNLELFVQNKRTGYLTALVIDKGNAHLQQYKKSKDADLIGKAVRIFKSGDRLLDRLKSEQAEIQSKLFWSSDSRRLYEHAIEACFLNGNTTDAFYFFEKSRSVLLHDQLYEQEWLGEHDILLQTQMKKKILQLERLHDQNPKPEQQAEIQKELFILKQNLDRLIRLIRNHNPLYYQSFLDTTFITVKQVQQNLLKDHQALVELFTGDSAVYSLVITNKKIQLFRISKQDFENTVNAYVSYIANPSLLNREYEFFTKTSRHLHQLLFAGIRLPAGRIIISPDSYYFPFEALVTSSDDQPVSYFVQDYAVSYSHSARYLTNHYEKKHGFAARTLMGVAPVHYPSATQLASLPGSNRSLIQLQSSFNNVDILLTTNASKANFVNNFHNYQIIQLYTHASDSGSTGEPVIYFADSALYLSDLIPATRPATKLIVLSACETGKGRWHKGEGIFSFNRSFAALGIPSSITNLWAVEDKSTYRLMELFYSYLADGMPADIALQKSKIKFLETAPSKEKQLPFYWAASILAGKTDAIKFVKIVSWEPMLLIVIIGLLFLVFCFCKKNQPRYKTNKKLT